MSRDEYLEHLASVPLFARCSDKELRLIGQQMTEIDVPAGRSLMKQGERATSFMIIMDGTVEVTRDGEHVADLGPGAILGEMAILMDRERSANATAKTDTTLLVGERRSLDPLLDDVPGLARSVLKALAERVADNEAHGFH